MVITCYNEIIFVHSSRTFKLLEQFSFPNYYFVDAKWSCKGKYIIILLPLSILLYSADDFMLIRKVNVPEFHDSLLGMDELVDFDVSPNEKIVVVYNNSGFAFFWNLKSLKIVKVFTKLTIKTKCRFIEDNCVIFDNKNGNLCIFDFVRERVLHTMRNVNRDIIDFSIDFDGRKMALYYGSFIHLYSIDGLKKHYTKLNRIFTSPRNINRSSRRKNKISKKSFNEIDFNLVNRSTIHSTEEYFKTANMKDIMDFQVSETGKISYKQKFKRENVRDEEKKVEDKKRRIGIEKFRKMLKFRGQYPGKQRSLIWKIVLQLPQNKSSFSKLMSLNEDNTEKQKTFLDQISFSKDYPSEIKNKAILRKLQKMLSLLNNINMLYATERFVSEIIYPFLLIYPHEEIVVFEIVLTFFHNWGATWFDRKKRKENNLIHGNVPDLTFLLDILRNEDPELYDHLDKNSSIEIILWSMIKNLYTENLQSTQWLILMDYVFTFEICFYYFFGIELLVNIRSNLLQLSGDKEIMMYLQNGIELENQNFRNLIKKALEKSEMFQKKNEWEGLKGFPKFVEKIDKGKYDLKEMRFPTVNSPNSSHGEGNDFGKRRKKIRKEILKGEKEIFRMKKNFQEEKEKKLYSDNNININSKSNNGGRKKKTYFTLKIPRNDDDNKFGRISRRSKKNSSESDGNNSHTQKKNSSNNNSRKLADDKIQGKRRLTSRSSRRKKSKPSFNGLSQSMKSRKSLGAPPNIYHRRGKTLGNVSTPVGKSRKFNSSKSRGNVNRSKMKNKTKSTYSSPKKNENVDDLKKTLVSQRKEIERLKELVAQKNAEVAVSWKSEKTKKKKRNNSNDENKVPISKIRPRTRDPTSSKKMNKRIKQKKRPVTSYNSVNNKNGIASPKNVSDLIPMMEDFRKKSEEVLNLINQQKYNLSKGIGISSKY